MLAENPMTAIALASNLVHKYAVDGEGLHIPIHPSLIALQLGIAVFRNRDSNCKWLAFASPNQRIIRLFAQKGRDSLLLSREMKMGTAMSLWYCLAGDTEQFLSRLDVLEYENIASHFSARAFAFELLMPYQSLIDLIGIHEITDIFLLAHIFDVEPFVLSLRVRQLGLQIWF